MEVAPLADERSLGQFQAEPLHWDAVAVDHLGDVGGELGVRQLGTRHVDGHGEVGRPIVAGRPLGELAAGLIQDERVNLADQPVLFGEGDEVVGWNNPALGVAPAHQCLDAHQRLVVQREKRLVEEEQFPVLDRVAQLGPEEARPGGDAPGGVEDPMAVPPSLLGLVHCPVSVADQLLGLGEGIAGDGDADAAGDREVALVLRCTGRGSPGRYGRR